MNVKHLIPKALGAFVFAIGITTNFAIPAAQAADPIRIGSVLSVTGPAAFLGEPELKTLELYIKDINSKGGVLGRPLELVHYDDGTNAGKANAFAKRLVNNDNVDIIVGGSTTGSTMSMVPIVERAGVPFISLGGAVVIINPIKKWVFKTPHTDRMAAEKVFKDMKKRGITKIALVTETSGFGKSGLAQSKQVAKDVGMEILASESYGPKDTDITPQLAKIKNTKGIQAVYVIGFGQGPAIVTKNYRQLGIKLPMYHAHGVASKQFIKLAGKAAEGVRLPASALLVADKLSGSDIQKLVVTLYSETYQKAYNEEVSTFGGHAFDGLMLAVAAIKKAGSVDKEKVRDALENTKDHIGTAGIVNMSATDHLGLDLSAFRMLEISNGDWKLAE